MDESNKRVNFIINLYMPFILSILFVISILQLLDIYNVIYYPMINRITIIKSIKLDVNLMPYILLLMILWIYWVISRQNLNLIILPLLSIILFPNYNAIISMGAIIGSIQSVLQDKTHRHFILGVLSILCGLEAITLFYWFFYVPLGWPSPVNGIVNIEMGLYYLASYFVPLLILPFLYMWIIKPLIISIIGDDTTTRNIIIKVTSISKRDIIFLVLIMVTSIYATKYPYLHNVNPEGMSVGVDISYYLTWMKEYDGNIGNIFTVARGSRPLFLLIIHAFQVIFNLETVEAILVLPVFLIPLLVLSLYFLSYEIYKNSTLSTWTSFFTLCGYHVTTGMYSYFLANIFCLTLIFFSLGFFVKAVREDNDLFLVLAIIIGSLGPFIHPWTFDQYFVTCIVSMAIMYKLSDINRGRIRKAALYFGILFLILLFQYFIFQGMTGVMAMKDMFTRIIGISNFWFENIFTFRLLYGGTMSCWLLFLLAIFGVYQIGFRSSSQIFLNVFLCLTSIMFLISDEFIKSRLLFNIPIGLFSAIGFMWLLERSCIKEHKFSLIFYTVLFMMVNLFRSLANLVP